MATSEDHQPTRYELHGDGTQITYMTSDMLGRADLSYTGPNGEHSFSGDDIKVVYTELGGEVTVTLQSGPDANTTTLTVLVPPVRLGGERSAALETFSVVTTKLSSFAGAPQGQGYRYDVVALTGEAQFVET